MKHFTTTNHILSTLLATSLSCTLLTPTVLANTFTDTENHWSKTFVTEASELGLVKGYEDGTFQPDSNISVAEFSVLVVNSYPELTALLDQELPEDAPNHWAAAFSQSMASFGLYPSTMPSSTELLNRPITREEGAYIINEAMSVVGKESNFNKSLPTENIADYSSITSTYKTAVKEVFLYGIMGGQSTTSTGAAVFNPTAPVTRAETCVIFLNVLDTDRRSPASTSPIVSENKNEAYPDAVFNENGQQIIDLSRDPYKRPQAVEGDIVLDKDGNEVVLVVGPSGVLGEGQGVAADLGLLWPWGTSVKEGNVNSPLEEAFNSLGNPIGGAYYWVNQVTGEGHWSNEWIVISSKPETQGGFDDQLSADKNWVWIESAQDWQCVFSITIKDSALEFLKEANGLL